MLFSKLNEDEFELNNEFEHKGIIYKEVRIKNRGCRCECGTFHKNVKEYKRKEILHSIYAHQKCIVIYHHRRFICPKCGATHMEDNPFSSDSNKISDQTILNVLTDLKKYNETFRKVAERYHLTTRGVMKLFDTYVNITRLNMPKVLCIDEIYFSRKRRKKYVLILLNFRNRAIVNVLKDRDKHTLSAFLSRLEPKERSNTQYVCIDMTDNYRDVISWRLPDATIVADSFHVMKHVTEAVDSVRKRVMRHFENDKSSDEYYLLKYRDHLLYETGVDYNFKRNSHFKRFISESQMLDMITSLDDDLYGAWGYYHQYRRFNDSSFPSFDEALNALKEIINDFYLSDIPEFISLASTLNNWKIEIANSFDLFDGVRVSNGPIEGRNSLIKKILKLANGYSNFSRFRNRIMYCLNKFSTHSFPHD
ncbi:MAG: ISL3 family transposase [Erysipelotrichaceae bacterium]|nr:ISL3 family transposase [Erysipelotrichaceae bacterium]MBR2701035.1 ISL3 family transposase [Erysipelotrichaceae bacterium]